MQAHKKLIFLLALFFCYSSHAISNSKIDSLNQLLELKTTVGNAKWNAYRKLASEWYSKRLDSAIYYVDLGLDYTKEIHDTDGIISLYVAKGNYFADDGDPVKAIDAYYEALYFSNLVDKDPINRNAFRYIRIYIGNLLYKFGEYELAKNYFKQAFSYFEYYKLDSENTGAGQAVALNNIALCLQEQNLNDSALVYYKRALAYRIPIKDNNLLAHSYLYISDAYIYTGQMDSAFKYINLADSIYKQNPQSFEWLSELQGVKARSQIKLGRYNKAIEVFEYTEYLIEKGEISPFSYYEIYFNNAEAYYLKKEYLKALKTLSKTDSLPPIRGHFEYYKDLFKLKFKIYQGLGDVNKALQMNELSYSYADSIAAQHNVYLRGLLETNLKMVRLKNEKEKLISKGKQDQKTLKNQKEVLFYFAIAIVLLIIVSIWIARTRRTLRKTQKELKLNYKQTLATINSAEAMILALNEHGKVLLINDRACRFFEKMTGKKLEKGGSLWDNISDNEEGMSFWKDTFKRIQTEPVFQEIITVEMFGKEHVYKKSFNILTNGSGHFKGLIMVGPDITKEIKFSEELKAQKERLNKSNNAKQKMLSILAHDLKDVIYSAQSLSELVVENKEEHKRDELIHYFDLLHQNFTRGRNLLEGILNWAKTQNDGFNPKFTRLNIKDVFNEVIEGQQNKAQRKNIELRLHLAHPIHALADYDMLKTILRNLVSNAIKYVEPELGIVTLEATVVQKGRVMITVSDNGIGFNTAKLDSISQNPGSYTTPGTDNEKGTGFGLSLVREMLHLHKATLYVESKIGKGTQFYFYLPEA